MAQQPTSSRSGSGNANSQAAPGAGGQSTAGQPPEVSPLTALSNALAATLEGQAGDETNAQVPPAGNAGQMTDQDSAATTDQAPGAEQAGSDTETETLTEQEQQQQDIVEEQEQEGQEGQEGQQGQQEQQQTAGVKKRIGRLNARIQQLEAELSRIKANHKEQSGGSSNGPAL